MGVIYSRMQVECTTLPDEDTQLFLIAKSIDQTNQQKEEKKNSVVKIT